MAPQTKQGRSRLRLHETPGACSCEGSPSAEVWSQGDEEGLLEGVGRERGRLSAAGPGRASAWSFCRLPSLLGAGCFADEQCMALEGTAAGDMRGGKSVGECRARDESREMRAIK